VAFTRQKLAVFVYGCFWHRCRRCYPRLPIRHRGFWRQKFKLNEERDARKLRDLELAGWEVLEVWECDVKASAGLCAQQIIRKLVELRNS
jgi:DNA mismatch endonuclease (patch repair protein)